MGMPQRLDSASHSTGTPRRKVLCATAAAVAVSPAVLRGACNGRLSAECPIDPSAVLTGASADRPGAVSNGAAALGDIGVCHAGNRCQQRGCEEGDLLGHISHGHRSADVVGLVDEQIDEPPVGRVTILRARGALQQVVEVDGGGCVIVHRL